MMKHVVTAPLLVLVASIPAAAQAIPRVESYFGYSHIRFKSGSLLPDFSANGGTAQLTYNFNRWVGLVGDFGGYHTGKLGGLHIDSMTVNFQAGPRLSLRKRKAVNPYIQALFGGVWGSTGKGPLRDEVYPILSDTNTAFAMLAGGGLDIKLSHRVSLRPIELDYFLSKLRNPILSSEKPQDNIRYSAGVSFLFGGEKPAPPPPPQPAPQATKACPDGSRVPAGAPCPKMDLGLGLTAARTEVCEGETVSLSPTLGTNRSGVSYQWSVNGQPVSQGQQFEFGSTGLGAGTYRVGVTATGPEYNPASQEVTITVLEYKPPTGTVQANPSEVAAGEKSTLTANFTGQCGGTIKPPVYTASEGTVQDNEFDSTGVQFDPSAGTEQRKAVTITAAASDDRNTGEASTTVTVIQKASAAPVRLPDILFPPGSARVNNCGKRLLLEQLRSYFERDPSGKAVLVGHNAPNERTPKLAEDRARNAAAVITAGSGVCLSIAADQVMLSAPGADQGGVNFEPNFCGPSAAGGASVERRGQAVSANDSMAQYRRVVVWFIPSGAQLPESVTNPSTASAMSVAALGCPK